MAPPSPPRRLGQPGAAALADDADRVEGLTSDEPGDAEADGDSDSDCEVRTHRVAPAQHGIRLDRLLVQMAGEFSRNHLQSLIERGEVQLDGQVQTTAARKVRAGQSVRLALVPTAESQAFRPEAMALAIVHEDEHLIIIDKPVGLVVHPAPGHWSGTLLNGLLAHHAGAVNLPRAGIVHRLDKDTSGLMVVAKTLPAMTQLVRLIAERRVKRVYLALIHGRWRAESTAIEAPIGRDPVSRVRMAVVASGKPARTDVEPLLTGVETPDGVVSALRCRLHTGRTHQIRVHLSARGHPLLADATYGGRPALGLQRQALHALELGFEHPADGRFIAFQAPLPTDLAAAWHRVAGTALPPVLGLDGLPG